MGFKVDAPPASGAAAAAEGHGGSGKTYMQLKNKRLVEQFDEQAALEGQSTRLFRGVVIYVNGNTEPSKDELGRLMAANGGSLRNFYLTDVTHVVAEVLTNQQIREPYYRQSTKIVKPQWIVDSIRLGKLQPEYKYVLDQLKDKAQPMMARFFAAAAASPTTAKPAPAMRDAADTARGGARGSDEDDTPTPPVRPAPSRRVGGSKGVVAARALWPAAATDSSRSRSDAAAASASSVSMIQRDPRKGKAPAHAAHAERAERAERPQEREYGERWYVAYVTVDAVDEGIATRLHRELVREVGDGRVVLNTLSEAAVDLRRAASPQEADRSGAVAAGMGADGYRRTDHERASEALERMLAAVRLRIGGCSVRGWLAEEEEGEDNGSDVAMDEVGAHAHTHACMELDGDGDGVQAELEQPPDGQAGGSLFDSEDFDQVLATIAAYTRDVDRLASGEGGAADLDNAESTDVTARVVLVRLLRYYLREAVPRHPDRVQIVLRQLKRTAAANAEWTTLYEQVRSSAQEEVAKHYNGGQLMV